MTEDNNDKINAEIRAGTLSSRPEPDDDADAAVLALAEAAELAAAKPTIWDLWNSRIRSASKKGLRP